MIIDISKIEKVYGTSLEIHLSEEAEEMDVNGQKFNFIKPINLNAKVTNLDEIYILEGTVSSAVKVACDRCLEELEYKIELKITEKFSKEEKSESEDINHFDGDIINLDEIVKNNIILNLPLQFLCSEKCKGLCPICGTNLNISQCNCEQNDSDPRLEKLKSLLKID